ncbi:hypothetical protein OUZ56_010047 [Daphnia magna]|uniref:Uncharacterized protein n=1 Tax=Daphnia magna TaxID=35525 RepID=A0ABR0AHR3_9CRUS|nr:hypothetical protein OUZ56_010047 [Daphnia magna]
MSGGSESAARYGIRTTSYSGPATLPFQTPSSAGPASPAVTPIVQKPRPFQNVSGRIMGQIDTNFCSFA